MDNIWQRRSNSGKLTLSTSGNSKDALKTESPRAFAAAKRFPETAGHAKVNPFHAPSATATATLTSPASGGGGASSAFGLGSGAFASFGSAAKAKSGGATAAAAPSSTSPTNGLADKDAGKDAGPHVKAKPSSGSLGGNGGARPPGPGPSSSTPAAATGGSAAAAAAAAPAEHPTKHSWVVWYRPPTAKHLDYEKSTVALAGFGSAEAFWAVYAHLRRPSTLPAVSDYHLFRRGVRPVWEDPANKRGGKWIVRLKKGVADRYWEDLLLAVVGDQFGEAGDEVCGAVLSVRAGEDVLSVWTRIDGGRNIKIRETIKRLLALPPDTNLVWKSHDDSIAQRTAFDQARQDKANGAHAGGKRRDTLVEETTAPEKTRA